MHCRLNNVIDVAKYMQAVNRSPGDKRVYLPLCEVAKTPFHL